MRQTLVLFRGDSEKIKEFDVSQTSKWGLLGRGIYLTDSKKTAQTYRSKGLYSKANNRTLFTGVAKDRPTALNEALKHYADDQWLELRRTGQAVPPDSKKYIEMVRPHFFRLVEEKKIVAKYLSSQNKLIEVVDLSKPQDGYLTEFHFNLQAFNTSVMKIDGCIKDRGFWELMWEHKVPVGVEAADMEMYCDTNCYRDYHLAFGGNFSRVVSSVWSTSSLFRDSTKKQNVLLKMQKILAPYGYRGFEYNGGRYLGGNHYHRAFCMWDDDFVNEHKVLVTR